ncbi:hypothetical protein Tco_0273730 [Tanacetum coccineum]
MADVNAPIEQAPAVAPPTRTDEQILPRIRWVPIGKSNYYLDAEKSFTAFSTIPAIYIQQFWDTICYDRTDGGYKCQLDEQWFNLTKDTLRDALQITPVNNYKAFSSPPTQDTLINFVNGLGYPKEVKHLSNVVTNDMFQPWRALTTIINLCLTGKTSGFERPRALVLQILWGVINRAHIDYAERMWEEFTQSIHTFTEDKKNLAQHTQGKKKATLIVIPSVRFTKLIIFHLQRKHKFHPRPEYPLHFLTEEPILGYLKFSAKGTKREVFGMPIPNEVITDDIRGAQDTTGALICRKLVDEIVNEGIPLTEPGFGDLEADTQRAIEESLKDAYDAHRGPLLPVVFRETDTGMLSTISEVEALEEKRLDKQESRGCTMLGIKIFPIKSQQAFEALEKYKAEDKQRPAPVLDLGSKARKKKKKETGLLKTSNQGSPLYYPYILLHPPAGSLGIQECHWRFWVVSITTSSSTSINNQGGQSTSTAFPNVSLKTAEHSV